MSWDTIRAEEYCESVRDGTHDTPKPVSNGYKLVTGKHIQNGQIDPTDAYFISENDYRKINERSKVEKWDVLMSMIGNGLGRSAVVKKEPDYAIKNIALFKVGDEKKAKWLHYYLSSPQGQGFIYNSLQGSGQPFISLSFIRNFPIPTPPLPYLNKAVSILEIYDDLIENNQKQIKLLEEAAQRLYKEWFVDLRFPGYENVKVVDGVPEGWKECTLDRVIEFNPKVSLNKERTKQFVPMSALSTNSMVLNSYEFTKTQSNSGSKFKNGDTLLARITPCLENGKTGFVSDILSDEGAVGSTEFIVMRSKSINCYMVYLLARTDDFRQIAINSMTGSDGRQRAQVDKIKMYQYTLPTQEIINAFETIVKPLFDNIIIKNKAIRKLTEARERLLPKLMSGELEV